MKLNPPITASQYRFSKNRKSQITATFTYLASGIIIAVILIFGATSIIKLMKTVNDIESEQFRREFEDSIKKASSSLHSVQYVELKGLNKFKKVCFVDYDKKVEIAGTSNALFTQYPTTKGDLMDTDVNIFIIKDNVEEKFSNSKITIDGPASAGVLCADISSRGSINLKIEGLGRKVSVAISDK